MKPIIENNGKHSAFALVAVLLILVMAVVLVVAFTLSMRTERVVASNSLNSQRAELLVQSTIATAVSLLAKNIPDPVDPTADNATTTAANWFTNPGRITVINSSGTTHTNLFSGEATTDDPVESANLNKIGTTSLKYPITGSDDKMCVKWVNVLSDPSTGAGPTNKVIGRYAFWIDDESSKINVNVARGKPEDIETKAMLPSTWRSMDFGWTSSADRDFRSYFHPTFAIGSTTFPLAHPAAVNLDLLGLTHSDFSKIDKYITDYGFIDNPSTIKNLVANPEDFYEVNKFDITPFSRSPEFNVFGKSRIFMGAMPGDLTTAPTYQHWAHTNQPMHFWGGYSGLGTGSAASGSRLTIARYPIVKSLASFLNREDWPGMTGKKLKWAGPQGKQEADQIAANITAMGAWAGADTVGSSNAEPRIVANAVFRNQGLPDTYAGTESPNDSIWKGPLSGAPVLPNSAFPQITEVAVIATPVAVPNSTAYYLKTSMIVEFYVPPSFSWRLDDTRKDLDPSNPPVGVAGHVATPPIRDAKIWWTSGPSYPDTTSNGQTNYRLYIVSSYYSVDVTNATNSRHNEVNSLTANTYGHSNNIYRLPWDDFGGMPRGTTFVSKTGNNPLGNTTNASTLSNGAAKFTGPSQVKVRVRLAVGPSSYRGHSQAVPFTLGPSEAGPSELKNGPGYLEFNFQIPSIPDYSPEAYIKSYEITDPRMAGQATAWKPCSIPGFSDTIPGINSGPDQMTSSAISKWGNWDLKTNSYRTTFAGMLSLIPTGMQRQKPWETMIFHKHDWLDTEIPDWVALDLIAPSYGYPISYANSTAGKINLNSKIYPASNSNFAPPARTKPLEAVFHNMPNASTIVNNIVSFQDDGGYFDYAGRLCEIAGAADESVSSSPSGATDFEIETNIRNLIGLVTTQSNTFGLWGAVQTVKKSPNATNYGTFQKGDSVTSERRFYAVIERYVWEGADGVRGNGKVDVAGGNYSLLASSPLVTNALLPGKVAYNPGYNGDPVSNLGTWAAYDGPQTPLLDPDLGTTPTDSANPTLESANNPLAAAMKYRIIYFTYLD